MTSNRPEIGIGRTSELSLRVSVATLVRVLFKNPNDHGLMLALERRATLRETADEREVKVKSQPFGGAIRILNLGRVHDLLGDFHFDSERSRAEQDFRILIRPSAWSSLREFCLQHIGRDSDRILETSPSRELVEEFGETLSINLKPEQYVFRPLTTIVENRPTPTGNIHAVGTSTVRVYRIFEACIKDSSLAHVMLENSEGLSQQRLCQLAIADAEGGGKGKASRVLVLPWKRLQDAYQAMLPTARNSSIMFEENQLDVSVVALLDGITVPRYQRV
jgi:hypothetical protein